MSPIDTRDPLDLDTEASALNPMESFSPETIIIDNPPLNLPVGSVRAIIALIIVVAVISFLIVGSFLLGPEFSLLAAGALIALATQVVEKYFGSRNGS